MANTPISGPGTTPGSACVDATIFPIGGAGKPTTTGLIIKTYVLSGPVDLASVTGVLAVANGGTGVSTGAWLLTGTSTLAGVATVASNTASQHIFNGTWTATANSQYHMNFAGTFTSRNTASDSLYAYQFSPTLNVNGGAPATQTLVGLLINPTFSGTATKYILDLQNAGDERFNVDDAGNSTLRSVFNGAQILAVTNTATGTSAYAQLKLQRGNSSTITFYPTNYTSGLFQNMTVHELPTNGLWSIYNGASGQAITARAATGNVNMGFKTYFGAASTTPTALLHIAAGTATAATAPLKFTSGTNMTTAEAGAMEYNGTNLFFTRAGTTREGVLTQSAVTTEVLVTDTSVTINIGGTTYKLLAKA